MFGHAVPMPVAFEPREYGSRAVVQGAGGRRGSAGEEKAAKDIEDLWGPDEKSAGS